MSTRQYVLNQELLKQHQPGQPALEPKASQLAQFIESRIARENGTTISAGLPQGVDRDLRPALPPVSHAALMLYTFRKYVDSYPLIYTSLALANPN